jgi:Tol biopolymer transport system component
MNANGSGIRSLTRHPGRDTNPAWSPNGHRIAFHSNRDGNWEIYIMSANGSDLRRVTHTSTDERSRVQAKVVSEFLDKIRKHGTDRQICGQND